MSEHYETKPVHSYSSRMIYDVSPRVNLLQNKVNSIYEHCFAMQTVWLVLLAQSVTRVWKLLLALPIEKRLSSCAGL
jgi:hypothetical protein